MSKNITIQEGGVAKQLTVDKLKTNLASSGICLWVPEDEVQLGTKSISENGTYRASDDGYYGYSEVTVSGIGTATGTGPDGETHSYTEDGQGGIIDNILPDSIAVITPPTVTAYADGATIDFNGMVVNAYLASGGLWTDSNHPNGVIPINELTLPVLTADASQVSGKTASSDLETDPASPLKIGSNLVYKSFGGSGAREWEQESTWTGGTFCVIQNTDTPNTLRFVCANTSNGIATEHRVTRWVDTGEITKDITNQHDFNGSYSYGGKNAYYYYLQHTGINTQVLSPSPEHLNSSRNVTYNTIAWTIVYGDITGGEQTIPVQFARSDGNTLESSFDITVT